MNLIASILAFLVLRSCAGFAAPVGCGVYLTALGVTAEEERHWVKRDRSREAYRAVSSLVPIMNAAPPEVWTMLSVARLGEFTTLAAETDAFIRDLATRPGVPELEILGDRDLAQVRPVLSGLVFTSTYGSKATRAWFDKLNALPARTLVLAQILSELDPPTFDATRGVLRAKCPAAMRFALTRARSWRGAARTFAPLVRSSRLLAANMLRHRRRTQRPRPKMVTRDAEAMIAWATDALTEAPGAPERSARTVSPEWTSFLKHAFDAIDLPPHRQPLPKSEYTEGESTLRVLLDESVKELITAYMDGEGKNAGFSPRNFTAWWAWLAFDQEMVSREGGAAVVGMLLEAAGTTFPRPDVVKKKFGIHLRARFGPALRDYYPLTGTGPRTETAIIAEDQREAKSDDDTNELDSPRSITEIFTTDASDIATADATDSVTDDVTDEVTDDVDQSTSTAPGDNPGLALPEFAELIADRAYHVEFARSNSKFVGPQTVRFTRAALEQIGRHTEVAPDAWLEALRRGLAIKHAQRGVKLLSFGARRGPGERLPVHIKLMLSTYRVTGDFYDGTWTFTGLRKEH